MLATFKVPSGHLSPTVLYVSRGGQTQEVSGSGSFDGKEKEAL